MLHDLLDLWFGERHHVRLVDLVEMLVDDGHAADDHGTEDIPRVSNRPRHLAFELDPIAEYEEQHVPKHVRFVFRRRVVGLVQLAHHVLPDLQIRIVLNNQRHSSPQWACSTRMVCWVKFYNIMQ